MLQQQSTTECHVRISQSSQKSSSATRWVDALYGARLQVGTPPEYQSTPPEYQISSVDYSKYCCRTKERVSKGRERTGPGPLKRGRPRVIHPKAARVAPGPSALPPSASDSDAGTDSESESVCTDRPPSPSPDSAPGTRTRPGLRLASPGFHGPQAGAIQQDNRPGRLRLSMLNRSESN